MEKIKIGKWEVSSEELEDEIKEATQQGVEQLRSEPQAKRISLDRKSNKLVIDLKNGVSLLLPREKLQGLANALPEDIEKGKIGPRGAYLHWDNLGVDFTLEGLLQGIFGTRAWMAKIGKLGGQAKSKAKTAACRINGRKGGRPRKVASPIKDLRKARAKFGK
jgi:Protein of unknown function (DUF2442)